MKNYNEIHRSEYVSSEWYKVHHANEIELAPIRQGKGSTVCSRFVVAYGVNRNEYGNFNNQYRYGVNKNKCLIGKGICYDEQ